MGEFSRAAFGRHLGSSAAIACVAVATPVMAQTRSFDVPAQDAARAIPVFAKQAGVQILAPARVVRGKRTQTVRGSYGVAEGLRLLLGSSGLEVAPDGGTGIVTLRARRAEGNVADASGMAGDARSESQASDIVVTGTRIAGVAPVGVQVATVDRAAINQSGAATANDLLKLISANTGPAITEGNSRFGNSGTPNNSYGASANLRGLGPGSTLVLLNGHRMARSFEGTAPDISQIPTSALERVDVLVDGASAVYGSDAIAGVINFVLRRDFSGLDASARYSIADGFSDYRLTAAGGVSWPTGNALISYEYFHRSNLRVSDRFYYSENLVPFGGPDLRVNNSNPGTISAGGSTYAIPSNQNGVRLPASSLVRGTRNLGSFWEQADVLPEQGRHSVVASVRQQLGTSSHIFADILYSHRSYSIAAAPQSATLTVPSTNPFFVSPIVGATTVSVLYNFVDDVGPQVAYGNDQTLSMTAGFDSTVFSDWKLNGDLTYGRNWLAGQQDNVINSVRLATALADSNPATAFNPFGDGSNTPASTIDGLRSYSGKVRKTFETWNAAVTLGGTLITMPAGPAKVLLGADFGSESYRGTQVNFNTTASPSTVVDTGLDRETKALYGEVRVPVVMPIGNSSKPGLTFSGALRYERYSDFGDSLNPKIGLEIVPTSGLTLRANWGSSFRAPTLRNLDDRGNLYQSASVTNASGQLVNVLLYSVYNSKLQPETANTWSAGFDFKPDWLSGLSISGSYFNVDFKDKILSLSGAAFPQILRRLDLYGEIVQLNPTVEQVNAIYNSPQFNPASPKPAASTIAAIVDGRFQNVGGLREEGVDASIEYIFRIGATQVSAFIRGTDILSYDLRPTNSAPFESFLNQFGNPIKWRGRAGTSLATGGWIAAFSANYVGSYTSAQVTPAQDVPAWTTFDLHIERVIGRAGSQNAPRLSLDIQNLFDRDPPLFANVLMRTGFDAENANPLGRVVSLTLKAQW